MMVVEVEIKTPIRGVCILVAAMASTLREQYQVEAVRASIAFAALGVSWKGSPAWPAIEDVGFDLRTYGDGVRDALLSWGIPGRELGEAAGTALAAIFAEVSPKESTGPGVPKPEASIPEPPEAASAEVRQAYHKAIEAFNAYKKVLGDA